MYTSISSMIDESIVSIYPYDFETCIVIYQDVKGNCQQINLEYTNDREKETIYLSDDKKLC